MPTHLEELRLLYPDVPQVELEALLSLLCSTAKDAQAWENYTQAQRAGGRRFDVATLLRNKA